LSPIQLNYIYKLNYNNNTPQPPERSTVNSITRRY